MKIVKTQTKDIPFLMTMFSEASAFLKKNSVNQWQNGYPDIFVIENDIKNGESYIVLNENEIAGTFVLTFREEETYIKIYNGKWLLETEKYGTIHRITVSDKFKGKGLGTYLFSEIEKLCQLNSQKSVRVDTHKDNVTMRNLILKSGYTYCGVIYLKDGNERLAYEKLII